MVGTHISKAPLLLAITHKQDKLMAKITRTVKSRSQNRKKMSKNTTKGVAVVSLMAKKDNS